MDRLVLALHLFANLLWVGAIVAVGLILAVRTSPAAERGKIARQVYRRVANPAFGVSFVFGIIRLIQVPHLLHAPFMHAKLTLALVVIGLHHAIGARARKMATGAADGPGPAPILAGVIVVAAALIVLLVVYRPFA